MSLIVRGVTENMRPNLAKLYCPVAYIARISAACLLVNLAWLFDSPGRVWWRSLLTISRILSWLLPSHKWLGLTQRRLSQVWQTKMPSGIVPRCNS